jgi:hypothetical protein
MLTTIIAASILVGMFFAMMAVRLIFLKNGEFKGTCASQSPFLNKEGVTCSVCGKSPGSCDNDSDDNNDDGNAPMPKIGREVSEVDKVMAKF